MEDLEGQWNACHRLVRQSRSLSGFGNKRSDVGGQGYREQRVRPRAGRHSRDPGGVGVRTVSGTYGVLFRQF